MKKLGRSNKSRNVFLLLSGVVTLVFLGCVRYPEPNTASDPSTTATKVYNNYCISCHGTDGQGTGPWTAAHPRVVMPDFTAPMFQASLTDDQIINAVTHGRGQGIPKPMPPWQGILSTEQISAVVTVVRSFGSQPELQGSNRDGALTDADSLSAARIFQHECSQCHGSGGNGQGPATAKLATMPRDFTDRRWQEDTADETIKEVIRHGGAPTGLSAEMPGFGRSLDPYLEGLVRYIRDFREFRDRKKISKK